MIRFYIRQCDLLHKQTSCGILFIMIQNPGKKWLYIFFFPYLLFALMGSLSLSINKTINFCAPDKDRISSNVCLTTINHTIDWLAVTTNTIRKAHKNTSFQLYSGLFHVLMLAGIPFAALCINKSHYVSIKNRQTANTKNIILLKLRI